VLSGPWSLYVSDVGEARSLALIHPSTWKARSAKFPRKCGPVGGCPQRHNLLRCPISIGNALPVVG
jgi:hypothetical protein